MVFPIHEQGLRIHTPKNQLLQRPAIRQTQATSASRRLVDHDGDREHEQNITDQTWLNRQLTAGEKHEEEADHQQEDESQLVTGKRAVNAYNQVEQSHTHHELHLPASRVMRSPVITLEASASINQAWEVLAENQIHHLVLVDDQGQLEGIVNDRDLLAEAAGVGSWSQEEEEIDLTSIQVRQLIKVPLITALENTDVRDIARLMLKHRVRAVPVLDQEGELLGLVTRSDLMLGLANQRIELDT
ncbi:CBS domain-containing protein [Marinospirillum perlucidum]|uniref:CBS domain-containing protein n=1 Tax=Marinospirillum perlucidum TaxID=1982602 RepID=UPI000DF48213|nr:CBS domain-containing protein [Marinospirillum perlucidum]